MDVTRLRVYYSVVFTISAISIYNKPRVLQFFSHVSSNGHEPLTAGTLGLLVARRREHASSPSTASRPAIRRR